MYLSPLKMVIGVFPRVDPRNDIVGYILGCLVKKMRYRKRQV